jgi:hypothetical protein
MIGTSPAGITSSSLYHWWALYGRSSRRVVFPAPLEQIDTAQSPETISLCTYSYKSRTKALLATDGASEFSLIRECSARPFFARVQKLDQKMNQFLEAFRDKYCISENKWGPDLWEETASCLQEAFTIFTRSLSDLSVNSDTAFYLLIAENTIGRLYDVSASMISCLASGATGGVESLARVVIEGAWTTRYMMDGDYKKRMFAYLFQYLREHPRKLDEWQQIVESTRPDDEFTLAMIAGRKAYIEEVYHFIDGIRTEAGHASVGDLLKHWTKSLFARCESLGNQEKYYTHYHRLSADSHHNAEQTIQYLHGYFAEAMGIKGCLSKMASESIHYSAMMAALAVGEAIVAACAACDRFGAQYDQSAINGLRHKIRRHADRLAHSAGAPE